jgi:hypothetical protein
VPGRARALVTTLAFREPCGSLVSCRQQHAACTDADVDAAPMGPSSHAFGLSALSRCTFWTDLCARIICIMISSMRLLVDHGKVADAHEAQPLSN